jgi:hypothetical protein
VQQVTYAVPYHFLMLARYAHHPAFAISIDTIGGPLPATVLLSGGVWLLQQLKRTSHYMWDDDFSRHSSHKQALATVTTACRGGNAAAAAAAATA